ncbi:MAG TPA: multicopper oxidase domain-containing protein [Actinomycetota bacterium]
MRRTRWSAIALPLALAFIAAACTGGGEEVAAGGTGDQAAGAPTTIDVTLTDFAIEPATIQAPAGAPLSFYVMNHGQSPHTFGIVVGGETYETQELAANDTATLEVPALEAGTYDTLCTVPGHDQLGMTGGLVVSADGATTGAAGATGATGAAVDHSNMTAEQMAEGHEQGVLDFAGQLENGPLTEVHGNQPMEPRMDGDVKVYDMTVTELDWEVSAGDFVDGMAFNGQIPGPEIRVNPGDTVRFEIQNQMSQPFVLHFHGLTVPNDQDGVPYITQPPIMPGEYWTYEFPIVDEPGMYVYHSHFNSTEQVGKGLYGAIFVEPPSGLTYMGHKPDVQNTLFLGDGPLGYNLNGKSFPATLPVVADKGDWVLYNIANDGSIIHPMHLHGFHFWVVAQDGATLKDPIFVDTLSIAPGQRFQILVKADYPGIWAFHCHILPHVEGPQGMFGMVTALIVQ